MPRTKKPTKRISKKVEETTDDNADKENKHAVIKAYIKEFDATCKASLAKLRLSNANTIEEVNSLLDQFRIRIPQRIGNKTIEEIQNDDQDSTRFLTFFDATSSSSVLEVTKSRTAQKKSHKRSLSAGADDGYLTAESESNSGGKRQSRLRTVQQNRTRRVTRSLSRNKVQQTPAAPGTFCTPINNAISQSSFGLVTPKVKPNTPQVILRRPKEGELAISMQGSPLMVNPILGKDANVNIPLSDGRTISIQPQRGLRVSQLPMIDPLIRSQILALRDNLNKLCK